MIEEPGCWPAGRSHLTCQVFSWGGHELAYARIPTNFVTVARVGEAVETGDTTAVISQDQEGGGMD